MCVSDVWCNTVMMESCCSKEQNLSSCAQRKFDLLETQSDYEVLDNSFSVSKPLHCSSYSWISQVISGVQRPKILMSRRLWRSGSVLSSCVLNLHTAQQIFGPRAGRKLRRRKRVLWLWYISAIHEIPHKLSSPMKGQMLTACTKENDLPIRIDNSKCLGESCTAPGLRYCSCNRGMKMHEVC